MLRREVKTITRSGDGSARLVIDDAGEWDAALITVQAQGAAGSALVVAPMTAETTNFTLADGTAIIAPGANAASHFALGLGAMLPFPLSAFVVALTVAGGVASIRVELSRHIIGEDATIDEVREIGKKLDALGDRIGDAVIEMRLKR